MATNRLPKALSILLVDPDKRSCELLKERLQAAAGWSLTFGQAADGETAMLLLKKRFFDLVFLACGSPGEDGLRLLDRIRQLHAKTAVIVMCAENDAQMAVSAMKKGALDCLSADDLPRTDFGPILRRLVETHNLITQNMELRQVNEMKNEFIANVSHELRAPLTVIMGYARSLQDGTLGSLSDVQRKAIDAIISRSEDLLGTLNHILRVREAVEGRKLAALKPTDLRELWRAGAEKANIELGRLKLRLEPSYPAAPVWIMADSASLGEVCDNLISNAIKFSPPGGLIKLAMGIADGRAWVRLQDQGAGIPPELLPRLFEDFSTASTQGPTRERPGLGLGLAICRQTVEAHGGSIWLESAGPGQGCTAHVSLPLTQADHAETLVKQPAGLAKKRVLIVEDNPDIIDIIRLFVSGISANLELSTAHSGFEALDHIKNQVPHLIIMDVMMPGMSGVELLERLRRLPETDRIPVLVLTGYSEAARLAQQAGAQEVLLKPFDRKVFVSKVVSLLQQADAPHRAS